MIKDCNSHLKFNVSKRSRAKDRNRFLAKRDRQKNLGAFKESFFGSSCKNLNRTRDKFFWPWSKSPDLFIIRSRPKKKFSYLGKVRYREGIK